MYVLKAIHVAGFDLYVTSIGDNLVLDFSVDKNMALKFTAPQIQALMHLINVQGPENQPSVKMEPVINGTTLSSVSTPKAKRRDPDEND